MAGLARASGPGELAQALAELRVRVDSLEVRTSAVPLPDYPGGPRPSSVVRLLGGAEIGLGEQVAFSGAEHEQFASFATNWLRTWGRGKPDPVTLRVGSALGEGGTPYERAALEAALVDLGLRQAGLSLYDLTGVREAALRFVVSFAKTPDPGQAMRHLRAAGYTGDVKLDVDTSWGERTLTALAREPGIAILDFKGQGDELWAARLSALFPHALLEDPASAFVQQERSGASARVSRDMPLKDAAAVAAACARGEAVNLKAPRMGGPLELLRGLAIAWQQGTQQPAGGAAAGASAPEARTSAYLGGMFEVGVGRSQAQQIAALYCADAPNDLATNLASTEGRAPARANSPMPVRLDRPGFGQL